jgi:hypothetical protein
VQGRWQNHRLPIIGRSFESQSRQGEGRRYPEFRRGLFSRFFLSTPGAFVIDSFGNSFVFQFLQLHKERTSPSFDRLPRLA